MLQNAPSLRCATHLFQTLEPSAPSVSLHEPRRHLPLHILHSENFLGLFQSHQSDYNEVDDWKMKESQLLVFGSLQSALTNSIFPFSPDSCKHSLKYLLSIFKSLPPKIINQCLTTIFNNPR